MTPPEIAAMLESLYRVRGGAVDFRTLSLQPRPFLGANGFQLDYEHLDGDELWRRGRAVGAVIDGRLYLILLDAARSHYYDADAARLRSDRRLGRSCRALADRRDRRGRRLGAGRRRATARRCSGAGGGVSGGGVARLAGLRGSAGPAVAAASSGIGGSCCMDWLSFARTPVERDGCRCGGLPTRPSLL